MPTIAYTQPKGGVGKTTSAIVLATELARSGSSVTLLDADPNQPLATWAALSPLPENLKVIPNIDEKNINQAINEGLKTSAFVIVDVAGAASVTFTMAVNASDLAIIPCQGSQLDAQEAMKAIELIKGLNQHARYETAHAVLLTRVPAVRSRGWSDIVKDLKDQGAKVFDTPLTERQAFRDIVAYGGTLAELSEEGTRTPNVEKAIENARAYVKEVADFCREIRAQREAA